MTTHVPKIARTSAAFKPSAGTAPFTNAITSASRLLLMSAVARSLYSGSQPIPRAAVTFRKHETCHEKANRGVSWLFSAKSLQNCRIFSAGAQNWLGKGLSECVSAAVDAPPLTAIIRHHELFPHHFRCTLPKTA